jgi:hypothetical protein
MHKKIFILIFILLIISNLFLMIKMTYIENKLMLKETEPFAVQDDVKAAINEVYQADVDAIRNLSAVAKKLQGGLTAAGELSVTGNLILTGANTWMLHTPDDGRKTLYFGKGANGGIDAWPVNFEENGTINANGNINAGGSSKINGNLEVGGKLILPNNTQLSADGDNATQWLCLQQTSNPGQYKSLAVQDLWCQQGHLYANNITCNQIKIGNITIRDNNIDFGDHWGGITTEGGIIMYYQRHSAGGGNMTQSYHGMPARKFCQVNDGRLWANDNWNNWRPVGGQ